MSRHEPLVESDTADLAREAQRQQQLLRALLGSAAPQAAPGWSTPPGPDRLASADEGFEAYRRNVAASAHRALEQAFPVLAQVLGEESMRALARALWLAHPPQRGDLGEWGAELAGFLTESTDPTETDMPYLPALAELEWAVHQSSRAADAGAAPTWGLQALAERAPEDLRLVLAPGLAALVADWPVVTIWQAHPAEPAEKTEKTARLDAARAALRAGQRESAWVWREAWRVQVEAGPEVAVSFTAQLLAGLSLGEALSRHPALDFESWLLLALRRGWLLGCEPAPCPSPLVP